MDFEWGAAQDDPNVVSARELQSRLLATRRPIETSATSEPRQRPLAPPIDAAHRRASPPDAVAQESSQKLSPTEVFKRAWLKCWRLPACPFCHDEHAAIDLVFRAFLMGWDEAFSIYPEHCRHWLAMREIDEGYYIPAGMNSRERFALLYLNYLIAAQPKGPSSEGALTFRKVPAWMRARPSQKIMSHNKFIDFIVWPLARERLVMQNAVEFTDDFFGAYLVNLRIYWPCSFGSAFRYDQGRSQYRLKDEVHARLGDLNHWRANNEFVSKYPQLEDDVNLVSTLPAFIQLWRGPVADREDEREAKRHRRLPSLRQAQDASSSSSWHVHEEMQESGLSVPTSQI